jgi:hypothetical protein
MMQRGAARISMNRLRAACLLLRKGGSSAVQNAECRVVSRWEFVSLLAAEATKLPACTYIDSSSSTSVHVPILQSRTAYVA